jgi:predicted phosphate transport protein (TIGR00153 family)
MFRIIPRDEEFFSLFSKASENIVEGAERLKELLDLFDDPRERARQIEEVEHKGDTITHDIIRKLNTTFITPIDREDILALASALDDVIDLIHGVATRLNVYKISATTSYAKELGFIILKSVQELHKGISHLPLSKGRERVYEHCVEVNSLENEADRVCRDAIAHLFENQADPITIIKWKEIYETLELATDRCEDAANVLESVALKNA